MSVGRKLGAFGVGLVVMLGLLGSLAPAAAFAGPATHFVVSAPPSATAGTAFSFTVTALDSSDNTDTSYSGTVHFTATDASAVLPADAQLNNGTGTFSATMNTPGSQTITATDTSVGSITGTSGSVQVASATTTTASNATATFANAPQSVTLSASISSAAGTVNQGTVTFTVTGSGATIGTATTSSQVSNGSAVVAYSLPAGTPAGSYTIDATYNPGGTFAGSSDSTHALTVQPAATTVTAANISVQASSAAQNVPLVATVQSPAGAVNEGSITFVVEQGGQPIGTPISAPVGASGAAGASYPLPPGVAAGTYQIVASYGSAADFAPSSDAAHTLTLSYGFTITVPSAQPSSPPSTQPSTPPPTQPTTTPRRPSNRFRVTRLRARPGGTVTFDVALPGPGRIDVLETAWSNNFAAAGAFLEPARGRFVFARFSVKTGRRTIRVEIRPNARGRQLLRHHAYKVRIRVWVTFTPTGGTPRSIAFSGVKLTP